MLRLLWQRTRKAFRMLSYVWSPGVREVKFAVDSLLISYGHALSRKLKASVDEKGNPLPWYTYPAIEYLESMDWSRRTIFEYGAGNSSLFWASRAARVTSVEHNEEWFNLLQKSKRDNHEMKFIANTSDYARSIANWNEKFDVVVIDGEARLECAKIAPNHLADDGIIILDNSDWFPNITCHFRSLGLLQVDFTGFGPSNQYTWTTSVFFQRTFKVIARAGRMPLYGRASLRQISQAGDPGGPGSDDNSHPSDVTVPSPG